jgi:hypothetical protein
VRIVYPLEQVPTPDASDGSTTFSLGPESKCPNPLVSRDRESV